MNGVRRALAFSVLERYLLLAIGLASNMAIARLLTPEVIGVYSVSMAFIGIAQVLRDFGVASYLIQERDLRDSHVRTAFGILLILGSAVFGALTFFAPLIARLYAEPAMVDTLRVCALNFLVLPFCTVSLSLLRREMAFKRLAIVGLAGALSGAVVSVSMAYLGQGVISLAVGSVVVNVVTGLGAWVARGDRGLLLPGLSEWRRIWSFGAQMSVTGVVTSVAMDINDLGVGKIMGFEPVAMLSRAQGLMNLFHRDLMSAIRNVAYPAYAKSYRDGQDLEPLFTKSVANVTAVAWPFYGLVSIFATDVMWLMFGPQWDAAAPLVPIFCAAGAIAAVFSLAPSQILAVGRVDLITKLELTFQPFRAVLVLGAALVFQSMAACAWALLVAFAIQLPLVLYVKGRCLPNDFSGLLEGLKRSLVVTLLCLAVPVVVHWLAAGSTSVEVRIAALLGAAASSVLTWVVALHLAGHPLRRDPIFHRLYHRLRGPSL